MCSLLALVPWLVAAHGGTTPSEEPGVRLVVLVVVDQLIPEQLPRLEPWLEGGLGRFVKEGHLRVNGDHGIGRTETGAGHATISTGVYPNRHGIVGNQWLQMEQPGAVYCVGDAQAKLVTNAGPSPDDPTRRSPKNLLMPGLADYIKSADPDSIAVSIGGKDRAAVLGAGRNPDLALWWDRSGRGFASSDHYGDQLPLWVRDWNESWPFALDDQEGGPSWESGLPPGIEASGSGKDDRPGEAAFGGGRSFPHPAPPLSNPPTPQELASLSSWAFVTPFVDRFVIDVGTRAIEQMNLGADEHTDVLFLGLSACDTTGHSYGPYSLEVCDVLLRLDRELGTLFELLDRRLGEDAWVAALTSDHGVLPLPERLQEQGITAKRIPRTALDGPITELRAELRDVFGTDPYVMHGLGSVRLSERVMRESGLDPEEVRAFVAEALNAKLEWIEHAFTLDELVSERGEHPAHPFMARSTYAGRSPRRLAGGQAVARARVPGNLPWFPLALRSTCAHRLPGGRLRTRGQSRTVLHGGYRPDLARGLRLAGPPGTRRGLPAMKATTELFQVGLGPLGKRVMADALRRASFSIGGAVDPAAELAGKPLSALVPGAPDVAVSKGIEGLVQNGSKCCAIVTTRSDLTACADTLRELLGRGISVVSSCEELSWPWLRHPQLAEELARLARENGARVLGTGVNPGFVMDALPVALGTACHEVRSVLCERVQDAAQRRLPFQQKIGATLDPETFAQRARAGSLRHVGLGESLHLVAHCLGWRIARWEEQLEPVLAETEVSSGLGPVAPGRARGVRQVARGESEDGRTIELVFHAAVGEPEPRDRVVLGGDPEVELILPGGLHGDVATSALLLNSVGPLLEQPPGLSVMGRMPLAGCAFGSLPDSAGLSPDGESSIPLRIAPGAGPQSAEADRAPPARPSGQPAQAR